MRRAGGGFVTDSGIKRASCSLLHVTLTEEDSCRHFVPGTKWKTPGELELFVCLLVAV